MILDIPMPLPDFENHEASQEVLFKEQVTIPLYTFYNCVKIHFGLTSITFLAIGGFTFMKQIIAYFKKETVLCCAWVLAIVSMFLVTPDKGYAEYIDFRSLGILWSLMVIMQGLKENGVFEQTGLWLLHKTKRVWQLCAVLIFLCFFSSMFITNDVALITFVPFAIMLLKSCKRSELTIPVVVLQTVAANLGSMSTPIGNPQNLYLYGISNLSLVSFMNNLLPYTGVSFILLTAAILFLPGKSEIVAITEDGRKTSVYVHSGIPSGVQDGIYGILFVIALFTVAKIIPLSILMGAVLISVCLMDKGIIKKADYGLLLTFIGFFIFTGNLGRIPAFTTTLASLVAGREVLTGVVASQCISNVPAALLLSGFTGDYKELLVGVNLGGLGTLIASMASLISYKLYVTEYTETKGKYFIFFTLANVFFLIILMMTSMVV